MKRIYQNNDLIFNLTIDNMPINMSLIESIEFKFYTINPFNYILKTHDDVNDANQVILQWDELKTLEEGVLYYTYQVSLKSDSMNDGTQDTVKTIMTQYYIVSDLTHVATNEYYTKEEIDELIDGVTSGDIDLTNYYNKKEIDNKLNNYVEDDVLGSYYTKSEVNELIDDIDIPTTDLTNYYTKKEVNDLIDGIDIPTQDVDLSNYYKKSETYSQSEVNALIDGVSASDVDLTNYYTKSEVDEKIPTDYITSIPSEYVTETELNNKGYLTEHQSLEGYAKLTDIPTDYIKSIPSEYVTESELNEKGYITTQYDDTEVLNRISALESEISGVTQQINELNGMIV